MASPTLTPAEIAARAEELYEQRIRSLVEADHHGDCVVIEVESGDYEVDPDHLTAAKRLLARRPRHVAALCRAHAAHPDGTLFSIRVGHPTAYRLGSRRRLVPRGGGVVQPVQASS